MDGDAIAAFVADGYGRVVAAVTLVTGDRAGAEDAVQEAVVRAWERLDRGEVIDSLAAWVTTVSFNLARSGVRRRVAERRACARLAASPESASVTGAERRIVDAVVFRAALARLPRRQREAVVLHYYLGFDVADTAAVMATSEGTTKTHLHRARAALALALDDDVAEEVRDGPR